MSHQSASHSYVQLPNTYSSRAVPDCQKKSIVHGRLVPAVRTENLRRNTYESSIVLVWSSLVYYYYGSSPKFRRLTNSCVGL